MSASAMMTVALGLDLFYFPFGHLRSSDLNPNPGGRLFGGGITNEQQTRVQPISENRETPIH